MSDDKYLTCNCKECGNPIEFPETAAGTTVACPHCGQWTELLTAEPVEESSGDDVRVGGTGLVVCIVLVAVVIGGYFFFRNRHPVTENPPTPPPAAKVVTAPSNPPPPKPVPIVAEKRPKLPEDLKAGIVQLEKTKGSSLVYAVGSVTNDSEYQRFGVRIELDLFNQGGKKLGTAKDYKDVIEPHHDWQFHALIPDSKTVSAKVASVKED